MTTNTTEPPEASPLWPIVVVLGEIAERVVRRRIEERKLQTADPSADDEAGGTHR